MPPRTTAAAARAADRRATSPVPKTAAARTTAAARATPARTTGALTTPAARTTADRRATSTARTPAAVASTAGTSVAPRALALASAFALAAACAPFADHPDVMDAAPVDSPSDLARLELGEGVPFRPIADGDTLVLSRGSQGGQHVCLNLRAFAMVGRGMYIRLWITRDSDDVRVTDEFTTRLSFYPPDAGGAAVDFVELPDLSLQFPNGDGGALLPGVLDETLTLHGEIRDRDGRMATADRSVRVAWGTNACSAFAIVEGGTPDGGAGDDGGAADGGGLDGGALDAGAESDAPDTMDAP